MVSAIQPLVHTKGVAVITGFSEARFYIPTNETGADTT